MSVLARLPVYYAMARSRLRKRLAPRTVTAKLAGAPRPRLLLHNPPFDLETDIHWIGYENLAWERETRRLWTQLCAKSQIILDIGANSRMFALLAKTYQPSARVYAFEPQPNVFAALAKNNDLNGFDIHCANVALADAPGRLPFYNYGRDPFGSGNTTAGSLNETWRPVAQQRIEVEVTTLDTFVEEHSVGPVDLIKIDVETFEPEVLAGYARHLAAHEPIIILEVQSADIGRRVVSVLGANEYR